MLGDTRSRWTTPARFTSRPLDCLLWTMKARVARVARFSPSCRRVHARRVIPSWDEPAFKASFDVSLTVPSGQTAVSNMPVAATSPAGEGLQTARFLTSP